MTYEELKETMEQTKFDSYGKHELLVHLVYVYEDNEGNETELIFAVPYCWLTKKLQAESTESLFDVSKWLDSEYTSDDSQYILEQAILENKVAFWKLK